MLTRRENLLIRPWQELRYINHRKKVQTALPAIDNAPPPFRQHVIIKLKRSQKETERCSQIVADNFTLLQHLTKIMSTTRINNAWEEPPPNFLNRVGMYTKRKKKVRLKPNKEEEGKLEGPKTRRERCYGCSPNRYVQKEEIPETRIPFEPPKEKVSRRLSTEQKGQAISSRSDMTFSKVKKSKIQKYEEENSTLRPKTSNEWNNRKTPSIEESQNVTLSKDGLTIKVSFPSKTEVEYMKQGVKKILQKEFCECKAFPKLRIK